MEVTESNNNTSLDEAVAAFAVAVLGAMGSIEGAYMLMHPNFISSLSPVWQETIKNLIGIPVLGYFPELILSNPNLTMICGLVCMIIGSLWLTKYICESKDRMEATLQIISDILKAFIAMEVSCIILFIIGSIMIPSASAAVFVYGSNYNYNEVVLPNNSYVHQGENISQGYYYYLSGVYGFSGKLAHWNREDDIGFGIPDFIVTIDPSTRHATFIDASTFPTGRWYQWDGATCDASGLCTSGFGNGNNYAFYVVKDLPDSIKEPVTQVISSNIVIKSEAGETQVPVTAVITVKPTPTPTPDIDMKNVTVIDIPTEEPTIYVTPTGTDHPIVTPRSPLVEYLSLIALAGVILWRRS